MTQEEKFEEAKRLYETANADQRYVLESLFPKLKESEEERISRKLVEYFLHYPDHEITYYGLKADSVIAWLEKQGKQKAKYHDVCDKCIRQPTCQSDCFLQQVEQNPSWSEKDEKCIDDLLHYLEHYSILTSEREKCINWLKSLKDRYAWKPSTIQMNALESAIEVLDADGDGLTSLFEQLKKL